jgi:enoyl-CoA hydratase
MEVLCERHERILVVTINRPEKRNAVSLKTAKLLVKTFREFENDGNLDLAILTGGGGTFCAGADLDEFANDTVGRISPIEDGPMGPTRLRLSKPVIAAIEGHAVAGGLELALWCDLRVMARDAILGVFCRRFGIPLIDLGTIRLPRLIGHSRAMDLILTGRPVSAEEAFHIGLANRLVEPGQALDHAFTLARELAKFPQVCMRNDRLSAIEQWDLASEEAASKNEFDRGLKTMQSGEAHKGAAAFQTGTGRHGVF